MGNGNIVDRELEKVRQQKEIRSLECMQACLGYHRRTCKVAAEVVRGRLYEYYIDTEGTYWYTSKQVS